MAMIEIDNLQKYYGSFAALSGISFEIPEGDIFGFIGPNGAGKTTTIKILATLLRPDGGTARVAGHDVVREPRAVRSIIGFMPDFFGVYDEMTTWEYLDFFGACYNIPANRRGAIIDDVLELTDLGAKRDTNVNGLSRGMKQRLSLARCLIHNPQVLLLDEPASGLDPRARIEIRELLKELGRMGKTILVSSHILTELADFCNAVGILEHGAMIAAGKISDLIKQLTRNRIIVVQLPASDERFLAVASDYPGVEQVYQAAEQIYHFVLSAEALEFSLPAAMQHFFAQGFQILSFREEEGDLEDIFLQVTKGIVN